MSMNPLQVFELKIILDASERCVYVYIEEGFVGLILKQIYYLVQILNCDVNDVTIRTLYIEKIHCVLRHQFTDSENYGVVVQRLGSLSVKSTVSKLITLMCI